MGRSDTTAAARGDGMNLYQMALSLFNGPRAADLLFRAFGFITLATVALSLVRLWPDLLHGLHLLWVHFLNLAIGFAAYAVLLLIFGSLFMPLIMGRKAWDGFIHFMVRMTMRCCLVTLQFVVNTLVLLVRMTYALFHPQGRSWDRVVDALTHYFERTMDSLIGAAQSELDIKAIRKR